MDVHLEGRDGKEKTSIFRKPIIGNTILLADSSHPKHTLRGITVGQFLRLKIICSDTDYRHEEEAMFRHFKDRGYRSTILDRAMNIAANPPLEHLLKDKISKRKRNRSCTNFTLQNPVFSTPFSNEYNKIKKYCFEIFTNLIQLPHLC